MDTLEQDRERALAAIQAAEEAKAFYYFFREYPELSCKANEEIIRDYHHGEALTLDSIRESAKYLGSRLAVKTEQQVFNDQLKAQEKAKDDAELANQKA